MSQQAEPVRKSHSVAYNVAMNAIVMTSSFIFPLITVPYISRVLLEYGNGLVSFAQSFVYYFSAVASMGVASYGVVACSRVRDDKAGFSRVSLEIIAVLVGSSFLMSILYLFLVLLLPRFCDARALYVFIVTSVWTTAFSLEWFFQSIEQYDYITVRALIVRTIGTVCIFLFVRDASDYLTYAIITVASQGASCLINLLKMRKLIDLGEVKNIRPLSQVKPMATYLVMNTSKGMASKSDVVVLGFLGTTEMVGVYQIASKIENMVVAAVESVGSVLLPRLTSYRAHGEEGRYEGLLAFGLDFALIIGLFGLGGTVLCASSMVGILGGEAYSGAVATLIALAPAILFASGTSVVSQVLLIDKNEKTFALANFVGLFITVVAALALVPFLGITGPGLAVSLGQLGVFVITIHSARSRLAPVFRLTDYPKITFAAVAACIAGAVVLVPASSCNVILEFIFTGCAFAIVFLAMLRITREKLVMSLIDQLSNKSKGRRGASGEQ